MAHAKNSGLGARGWLWAVAVAALVAGGCERQGEPVAGGTAEGGAGGSEWREFEGSWTAAGTRQSIPLGTERKGSIIELRGAMLLAGSGRPGVGFRAEMIGLVDSETGLVGRGVWTDEHGDQVFSELKGEGTKENNHITGTFLGGTGPYSGVKGEYEFSWQFVIETEDGSIQGRAVGLKGRYRVDGEGAKTAERARSEAAGARSEGGLKP